MQRSFRTIWLRSKNIASHLNIFTLDIIHKSIDFFVLHADDMSHCADNIKSATFPMKVIFLSDNTWHLSGSSLNHLFIHSFKKCCNRDPTVHQAAYQTLEFKDR